MRLPRVPANIRNIVGVAMVMALLGGGLVLLFKNCDPTRIYAPHCSSKRSVIMEGVDINSNGQQHRRSSDRRERTRLFSGAIRLPTSP